MTYFVNKKERPKQKANGLKETIQIRKGQSENHERNGKIENRYNKERICPAGEKKYISEKIRKPIKKLLPKGSIAVKVQTGQVPIIGEVQLIEW